MSVVKKTAKASLYIFSFFVILFVAGGVYLYVNVDSLAKQLSEQVASDALGVPVTIGEMHISLEEKKVEVKAIKISNPAGYRKPHAVEIASIVIAAETLSKELLNFARVEVDGTITNLEVKGKSTNLGDLKAKIDAKQSGAKPTNKKPIKVIVQKFSLTKAQLNPSVILLNRDLAFVTVPDIHLIGVGEKDGGVIAQDAIAQIMEAVLGKFTSSANSAGFLEGLSLDVLNQMGVSTGEVFKKNLKKSFDKDVEQLKQGVEGLKGLFRSE